jgi:hypothetical protein
MTTNNIFKLLTNLFLGKTKPRLQGTTKSPFGSGFINFNKETELTISELPLRNTELARELIEIKEFSYEASHAVRYASRDVFSSNDGDDIGWTVAQTLDDNKTPIDPVIYETIIDLVYRRCNGEWVIGGNFLKLAIKRMLFYGDAFLEIAIDNPKDGIVQSRFLPTWQISRITDDNGNLTGYKQKQWVNDNEINFLPSQIVQFSYEREGDYGCSLFSQSIGNWANLKQATFNLAKSMRDNAISPFIHIMPEGTDVDYRLQYQQEFNSLANDGIITNLFLDNGTIINRLSGTDTGLDKMINYWLESRKSMIPPGFPLWLFPCFEVSGGKDIAGQPALAYKRMRNDFCACLSEGIRQVIDIEIVLRLGYDKWKKDGKYRIIFPKWDLNIFESEDDILGIHDLDK